LLLAVGLILIFTCAMIGMIAAAGYAGAQAGQQEAQIRHTATVAAYLIDRFQKGNDQLREGKYALAEANFIEILRYQPDNFGVRNLAATARVAQTPIPPTPTSTPTPVVTDKNALLNLMQAASEREDWDAVISLADQLIALDTSFETDNVTHLRYEALVSRGLARLRGDEIEAGLYDLDQAAAIRPLSGRIEGERRIAASYQNALYYFGADWERAIELLEQIYRSSPGYRNVAAKLAEAYVRAGDAYAGISDWCPAAKKFAGALAIRRNTTTEQKQLDAEQRCLAATPIGITGTVGTSATANVSGATGVNGRIYFSKYDAASGQYGYYTYDGASSTLVQTGSGQQPAYRPSLSPDRTRTVYPVYQDNAWRVVVAGADGSSPAILTNGTYPVWGPNGAIAFQGCTDQCGIHVINPDQPTDVRRLTSSAGDINIQWSPTGDRLIYMSNYSGPWEIYTVSLSGAFQQLTGYGASSGAPAFSPGGAQIAFISNRDGNWGVYVMNADGSNALKVIDLGPQHPGWQSERLVWTY
jgi:tetratricopeptide (TPR) repeat protein